MARKRQYTQELLKAQAKGCQIVSAFSAIYPLTRTGEWPVVYRPRHKTDAHPWLEMLADGSEPPAGKGIRYSGRQCTVESRYLVERITGRRFMIQDLFEVFEHSSYQTYAEAASHAREFNRRDRVRLMDLAEDSGA